MHGSLSIYDDKAPTIGSLHFPETKAYTDQQTYLRYKKGNFVWFDIYQLVPIFMFNVTTVIESSHEQDLT